MNVDPHLVYDINESLSLVRTEETNHLYFVLAGEYLPN